MIISTVITTKKYERRVLRESGFDEEKRDKIVLKDMQSCLRKINEPEVRRRTLFIYTVAGAEDNKPDIRNWDDKKDNILMPLQFAVSRN